MATLRQPRTPETPQDVVSTAGAAVCGVLEDGVRTAYTVIDDYLRRGQAAARGIFNDSNKGGPMSDVRGNCGYTSGPQAGYGQGGGYYPPWNPMALMVEQWIAAMRAWTGFWFACVPGPMQQGVPYPVPQYPWSPNPPAPGPATTTEYPSRSAAASEATSTDGRLDSVSVTVSSASGKVECMASLSTGVYSQGLACDPLHAHSFKATDIVPDPVICESGVLRVTVKVPSGQPVGKYSGLIRKKPDQSPVGEVTVVVAAVA